MTIRDIATAKLQELPESLLQEVNDFIDFVTIKHQRSSISSSQDLAQRWQHWFEEVENLEVSPVEQKGEYQELLLNKYRQQGLLLD